MKYEQYLEWQRVTGEKIAAAMERFSIKEGRNAQVFGNHVGVEVPGVEAERKIVEPTWQYVIYGTITTRDTGAQFGPHLAATILRPGSTIARDGLFEEQTQVIVSPGGLERITKVEYFVTTLNPKDTTEEGYPKGIYRGGLRLTCDLCEEVVGQPIPVQNYTLNVGRNGDSVTLTPPDTNKLYFLRIRSAERL